MIAILCTWLMGFVQAETTKPTVSEWSGKFHISGFSFVGSIPGSVTFGPNNQSYIALFRPSGMPIMSVTSLTDQICFRFDMDGVQYQGTPDEFSALSNGALPADKIPLLFLPDTTIEPDEWYWLSTPRHPVRRLTVESDGELVLRAKYRNWTKDDTRPKHTSIYLEPNTWKLRANFRRVNVVEWFGTCEVPEDIQVLPLNEMLKSIPKK